MKSLYKGFVDQANANGPARQSDFRSYLLAPENRFDPIVIFNKSRQGAKMHALRFPYEDNLLKGSWTINR